MQTEKPNPTPEQFLDALANDIRKFKRKFFGAMPRVIIMNYKTANIIYKLRPNKYISVFYKTRKPAGYFFYGVRVYRTFDISETDFRVL